MSKITYINPTRAKRDPLWWHDRGLQQTASGYGSKLTTPYKAEHNGRFYRVYCICWSNAGSLYIISKGQKLYIRVMPEVGGNDE